MRVYQFRHVGIFPTSGIIFAFVEVEQTQFADNLSELQK